MKLRCSNRKNHALTLAEVLFVVAVLTILATMILPALTGAKHGGGGSCNTNLRQIGGAYQMWAGDNNNKYPMEVSTNAGGVMELAAIGNAAAVFQVMSNELSTPRVLICPKDKTHQAATNQSFTLTSKNISYFVGLDAGTNFPYSFLSGDNNLEFANQAIKLGLQFMATNAMYFWSADRHNRCGNILLADGSVQAVKNTEMRTQVSQTGLATNRLAIP